jgi:hypothetical protein
MNFMSFTRTLPPIVQFIRTGQYILRLEQVSGQCTGRKISARLTYITVTGEGKMERARGEQDAIFAVASLLLPRTSSAWPLTCVFVTVNEAQRYLATSLIRWLLCAPFQHKGTLSLNQVVHTFSNASATTVYG